MRNLSLAFTRVHNNVLEEEKRVTRPISPYKIVYRAEDMKCTIFRTSSGGGGGGGKLVPTVIDSNAQV